MKRITSIKNAIKYFKEKTMIETRTNRDGEEYNVYIPPKGFHKLNISEYFYDTKGHIAGTITQFFFSFQWKDYAQIIEERKEKIVKLQLYYE